jgi:hypothetical protein
MVVRCCGPGSWPLVASLSTMSPLHATTRVERMMNELFSRSNGGPLSNAARIEQFRTGTLDRQSVKLNPRTSNPKLLGESKISTLY